LPIFFPALIVLGATVPGRYRLRLGALSNPRRFTPAANVDISFARRFLKIRLLRVSPTAQVRYTAIVQPPFSMDPPSRRRTWS